MNLQELFNNPTLHSFGTATGIGAAVLLLGSGWKYIKGFFDGIRNVVFSRSVYKNEASNALMSYVFTHGRKLKFGMRAYRGSRHYVNTTKRVESIAYEDITNEPTFVWLDGRPILIRRSGNDSKTTTGETINYQDSNENSIELVTLRGIMNLDHLTLRAMKHYNESYRVKNIGHHDPDSVRFTVKRLGRAHSPSNTDSPANPRKGDGYTNEIEQQLRQNGLRLLGYSPYDIGMRKNDSSAFNVFFFPDHIMQLVQEIRSWLRYEDWFKDKGMPWRLGCLFYGKPGTGKSTLIRSIAMDLDLPIFILDLTSMDNASLVDAWDEVQQNAPAIALIEDIDSVFHGRKNVATTNVMRDSLTFDCLLNTISGVKNSDGVLLCVTTNDISKIDSAIGVPDGCVDSTRPGRIDRAVELTDMQTPERRKVAEYILKDTGADIEQIIADGDRESAAQFQARCTNIALAHFWKTNKLK